MLSIIVIPRREGIVCAAGMQYTVFETETRIKGVKLSLADLTGIVEADVEIVAKKWFLRRRLTLTPGLKQALLKFIGYYSTRPNPNFDCYAFVNTVFGVQLHPVTHLRGYWNMHPLDGEPVPGQAIFLLRDGENSFRHAAICLELGLYVSVYGGGGVLEVSGLADMKQDFDATDIMIGTPRNDAVT